MLRLLYAKHSVLQSYYGRITITLRKLFDAYCIISLRMRHTSANFQGVHLKLVESHDNREDVLQCVDI